jgi:hypothetical protein
MMQGYATYERKTSQAIEAGDQSKCTAAALRDPEPHQLPSANRGTFTAKLPAFSTYPTVSTTNSKPARQARDDSGEMYEGNESYEAPDRGRQYRSTDRHDRRDDYHRRQGKHMIRDSVP